MICGIFSAFRESWSTKGRAMHARAQIPFDSTGGMNMSRLSTSLATACAILSLNICPSARAESAAAQDNPVIQWNKTLLTIVRTPGAQPATVHPTRSFAVMHAAMYDAVNAIDGSHKPYLVHLTGVSANASQ